VVSVSADEKVSEASAFAKEIRATFPVVHDPKSTVTDKFHVLGIPANVVIDRGGKVAFSEDGGNAANLEKAIVRTLGATK
jgi:peroxiredoxin